MKRDQDMYYITRDPSIPATNTKTVVRHRALGFRGYARHETLGPEPFRVDEAGFVYVEIARP